ASLAARQAETVTGAVVRGHVSPGSPQIQIEAKFIEVPEAEAQAFCAQFSVTNATNAANWSVTLSAAQAAAQLARWKAGPGEVLSSPKIITLSGREARLSVQEPYLILTRTNSVLTTNQVYAGTV